MSDALEIRTDSSALDVMLDAIELVVRADAQRAPEMVAALSKLKAEGAAYIFTEARDASTGGFMVLGLPHPRLIALHESLKLRSRLNLPTGEVAV